jgi:glycosyltransferase involved in cell wall biosynthesis
MNKPFVTIVVPCRNEAGYIAGFLNSVTNQDYGPDRMEVLIGDGMSDDGTRSKVEGYPGVKVIDNPERTVPFALNRCIEAARGEVVIRMDVHAIYPANYVSRLVEVLLECDADNVGGVLDTVPANDSAQSGAIAAAMSHPFGVGNASFRTGVDRIVEVDTVPFGCFKRELFDRIGKFDTDLTRNQDDEFNARIIQAGGKILLVPDLRITYFARARLRNLIRMYFQYGYFKPLVNTKLDRPATLRQFIPPLFVLFLLLGLPGLLFGGLAWGIWSFFFGLYFIALAFVSLLSAFKRNQPASFFWLLLAFFLMHIAYGWGYLKGVWHFLILRKSPSTENTELSR